MEVETLEGSKGKSGPSKLALIKEDIDLAWGESSYVMSDNKYYVKYAGTGSRSRSILNSAFLLLDSAFPASHLVSSQILVIQPFEPFAKLVAGNTGGVTRGQLGILQHVVVNEDWAIHAQGQGESV